MNSKRLRSGAIYLLLVIALGAFLYSSLMRRPTAAVATVPIGDVAALVRAGDVDSIVIDNDKLVVTKTSGEPLQSRIEDQAGLINTLTDLGVTPEQLRQVEISVANPQFWDVWSNVLLALVPLALLGAFFFFIMRQAQGAGNQAFSFGKSRARMFTGDRPTVTFVDVAGNDEAKQELQVYKAHFAVEVVTYEKGKVGAKNSTLLKIKTPYILKNKTNKIAVLIGEQTASSGEMTVRAACRLGRCGCSDGIAIAAALRAGVISTKVARFSAETAGTITFRSCFYVVTGQHR